MEFGRLKPEDADALGPLHNRLWRTAYDGLLPELVLAGREDRTSVRRWRERALAQAARGLGDAEEVTYVARGQGGDAVGWITFGPARDSFAPEPLEIWSLYVATHHHGTGVAQRLLTFAPKAEAAYLWVLAGNFRAIAFYRKMGFTADGTLRPFAGSEVVERRMVRSQCASPEIS